MNSLFTYSHPRRSPNCPSSWNPSSMSVAFLLAAGDRPSLANQGTEIGLAGSASFGLEQAFGGIHDQLGLRTETELRSGWYRCKEAVPIQD